MLERVARALTQSPIEEQEVLMKDGRPFWQLYLPDAVEALKALREPTPEMVDAFHRGFLQELHKPEKKRTSTAEAAGMRAMIDAALKEQA
ncbi:hypothetical protein [Caldimonas brevitalea]|uniref:Uncharacterized protein n=1 Tax=Caldimonas brevitalea TaxID=413882 RepID=A0A0G3BHJ9_9BURK|nr:hypothetical protein [Caldimonas brevitalea]AKJ28812.1 hypothetical protein AAW51_2121 [Caldimonas brevitalea]